MSLWGYGHTSDKLFLKLLPLAYTRQCLVDILLIILSTQKNYKFNSFTLISPKLDFEKLLLV